MQNNNWNDIFGNIFDAYKTTGEYQDSSKMEIALRKEEFEKALNDFYEAYRSNPMLCSQISGTIKSCKRFGV